MCISKQFQIILARWLNVSLLTVVILELKKAWFWCSFTPHLSFVVVGQKPIARNCGSNAWLFQLFSKVNSEQPDLYVYAYLSTFPISSGDSRFRGFLPITRSQRKISRYHAQEFLNLKINQFFEKLINFVRECVFFSERERIHFDPCFDLFYIFQEFWFEN